MASGERDEIEDQEEWMKSIEPFDFDEFEMWKMELYGVLTIEMTKACFF